MYVRKTKRGSDVGDVLINVDRAGKSADEVIGNNFTPLPAGGSRRSSRVSAAGNIKLNENKENNFQNDELPDGACIAPLRLIQRDTDCTAVREAAYIGSFSVIGTDQSSRADYVRQQLADMRGVARSKAILLVVSLTGIKICSNNGESVYMAHALKRISYATCDPEFCQFSFLAREPKSQLNNQYCHAFITATPEQAEDLNVLVGNAFKMAYSNQRQKQPSFNQLIEEQLEEQKSRNEVEVNETKKDLNKRLSLISTTAAPDLAQQRKEFRRQQSEEMALERERRRLAGRDRVWAKQAVQKTKHKPGFESPPPPLKHDFDFQVRAFGSPVVSLKDSIDNHEASTELMQRFAQYRPESPLARPESPLAPLSPLSAMNGRNSPKPAQSPLLDKRKSSPQRSSPRLKRRERPRKDSCGNRNGENGVPVTSADGVDVGFAREPPHRQQSPLAAVTSSSGTSEDASPMEVEPYLLPCHPRWTPESNSPASSSSPKPPTRALVPDMARRPLPAPPPADDDDSRSDDSILNAHSIAPLDRRLSSDSGQSHSPSFNTRSTNSGSPCPDLVYNHDDFSLSRRVETDFMGSVDMLGPPPPLPLRLDSLRRYDASYQYDAAMDDNSLQHASWYQAGIPREIALEILSQEEIGSFIVRDSTTHPSCFALSVRVPKFENPTGISHYLIKQTSRGGFMLKGLDKEWPNLTSLVTHHTVMQEKLPCTLRLPRNSQNPTYHDVLPDQDLDVQDGADDDDDYQRLSDFTSMMADLKMEK